jgi:chemotaxis methyl-accepting protein methylase
VKKVVVKNNFYNKTGSYNISDFELIKSKLKFCYMNCLTKKKSKSEVKKILKIKNLLIYIKKYV